MSISVNNKAISNLFIATASAITAAVAYIASEAIAPGLGKIALQGLTGLGIGLGIAKAGHAIVDIAERGHHHLTKRANGKTLG